MIIACYFHDRFLGILLRRIKGGGTIKDCVREVSLAQVGGCVLCVLDC